jgi:prolyl oligopeptidase
MLITALALLALQAAPPTNTAPATDTYFGETVTDDYRWLEKLEKDSPEVKAWTDTQLNWLRTKLDTLPCRTALATQLRPLMTISSWSVPIIRGAGYFFTQRQGAMNQPALYVRNGGANTGERMVLDPNEMDPSGLTSLDWWTPSWQGSKVAFGTSKAGDEMSVLRVIEVGDHTRRNGLGGKLMKDEIPGKVSFGGWNAGGDGFVYSRLADPKDPYSRVVAFHRLGTPVEQDPVFMKQEKPAEVPFGSIGKDDKWVMLGTTRGWSETDLWCAELSKLRDGKLDRTPIAVGRGARFMPVEVVGDTLYMTTTLGAPNVKLVKVDLRNPAESNWKVLVDERKDAVMTAVDLGKDEIAVTWQKDAHDVVQVCKYDGSPVA